MSDKKDLHLMLSSSFWVKTFSQLIGVGVVMYAAMQIPALALRADTFMQYIHFKMVDAADYLAWWSLLAMLSSACCALQLILNLLSVGCAGFNTVLGPWRPTFMAVMILMQVFQWRLASERFDMVNRAIISTALSAILAILPELLYLKNVVWKRAQNSSTSSSESASKLAATGPRSVIVLKTEDMGCIACVDTVRNCVLQLPKVTACEVAFESKLVYVTYTGKHQDEESKKIASQVIEAMDDIGFGATLHRIGVATSVNTPSAKDDTSQQGEQCYSWVTSVVAGLLSSSCCLLQLGFNFLSAMDIIHVGCAGFNKVLGPVRSILRGITGAGLVCLWTVTAWQFLQSSQSNGSKSKSSSRIGRGKFGRLLLQTVITVSLMFMPEVLKHMGGPKVAPPVDQVDTHIVTIDNMGCEACEYTVQGLIDRTDGVVASNLDFSTGIAKIYVAKDWGFDLHKLEDELMYRGYTLLMGTGHETVHMRRMKRIQKKQNKTKKGIKTGATQADTPVTDAKM